MTSLKRLLVSLIRIIWKKKKEAAKITSRKAYSENQVKKKAAKISYSKNPEKETS